MHVHPRTHGIYHHMQVHTVTSVHEMKKFMHERMISFTHDQTSTRTHLCLPSDQDPSAPIWKVTRFPRYGASQLSSPSKPSSTAPRRENSAPLVRSPPFIILSAYSVATVGRNATRSQTEARKTPFFCIMLFFNPGLLMGSFMKMRTIKTISSFNCPALASSDGEPSKHFFTGS